MYEIMFVKTDANRYSINIIDSYTNIDIILEMTNNFLHQKLENYEQWLLYHNKEIDVKPICDEVDIHTIIYANEEVEIRPESIEVGKYVSITYSGLDLINGLKYAIE